MVIAHRSSTSTSGSLLVDAMSWLIISLLRAKSNRANLGSSASGIELLLFFSPAEYQGRRDVSPPGPSLTTRHRARVVGTPRRSIASLPRNSRTDDRNTARPSAPRQNGVCPAPLSCSSYRPPPNGPVPPPLPLRELFSFATVPKVPQGRVLLGCDKPFVQGGEDSDR